MVVQEGGGQREPDLGREDALAAVGGGAADRALRGAMVQRGDAVDHEERAELGREDDALVHVEGAHSGSRTVPVIDSLGQAAKRSLFLLTRTTGGGSSTSHNPPPSSVSTARPPLGGHRFEKLVCYMVIWTPNRTLAERF